MNRHAQPQTREQINTALINRVFEDGLLSQEDMSLAEQAAARAREPLETHLFKGGWIPEDRLVEVLAKISGYARAELGHGPMDAEILSAIPVKTVARQHVMPLKRDGRRLTIATNRIFEVAEEDRLRLMLDHEIEWRIAGYQELNACIKHFYGIGLGSVLGLKEGEPGTGKVAAPRIEKFIEDVLEDAISAGATDIHFEPLSEGFRLRYRIDGVLCLIPVPDEVARYHKAIISATKVKAQLKIEERGLPQDGRFSHESGERSFDLRVSVLPTGKGESLNIRVLNRKATFMNLDDLGLRDFQRTQIEQLLSLPNGIVLYTGPTGSGKTTSLYAAMAQLNNMDRKIITLEDPVEYQIEGITQMQIHAATGFTFASGLRSILRHDPDIVLIGEIRDPETAAISISASQTGHLVFSTLHTNDSPSAITRLLDMGIEPYMVASSLQGIIAQRMVRKLCRKCRTETKIDEGLVNQIRQSLGELPADTVFFQARGCPLCRFTGYDGRIAIFEVLMMDDTIRHLTVAKADSSRIMAYARNQGLQTLRPNGWQCVVNGITSVDEVLRLTMSESSQGLSSAEQTYLL